MKLSHIILAVLVVTLAAGCCSCKKGKKDGKPLHETHWVLTQFEGREFHAGENNYWIEFNAEGRMNGRGDCNGIFGPYTVSEDGLLSFGMLAGTKMFCPNQQMEDKFNQAISSVDSYKIDGDFLLLYSNGEMVGMFEAKMKVAE